MREKANPQLRVVPAAVSHGHAEEMETISDLLDQRPEAVDGVHADLVEGLKHPETGRPGMTAEQVLRAIIVRQMNGFSYEQLAFHLEDSATYRRFCRIGFADKPPSADTLQRNIKKVRAETLEAFNKLLMQLAGENGIEDGAKIRADCTVTETNIHEPTDSSLLDDCVRVLARILKRAAELASFPFTDHHRRARRRAIAILNAARKKKRKPLYRDLIKLTEKTVRYATTAAVALDNYSGGDPLEAAGAMALAEELRHYIDLAERVLDQTRRRVLQDESVPARDKIVSIFEPHTDIIRKDRRDTYYGHKLCLSSGASGLITDCVVLDGNPADATLAVQVVQRHQSIFGQVPRQMAYDGGFSSKANLAEIKALGVQDVAFSKGRGLEILDMVKSIWLYRQLKNFRAGIEAGISWLKRVFGLDRCRWRSLPSFKSYVWSGVITANLLVLARHQLA